MLDLILWLLILAPIFLMYLVVKWFISASKNTKRFYSKLQNLANCTDADALEFLDMAKGTFRPGYHVEQSTADSIRAACELINESKNMSPEVKQQVLNGFRALGFALYYEPKLANN